MSIFTPNAQVEDLVYSASTFSKNQAVFHDDLLLLVVFNLFRIIFSITLLAWLMKLVVEGKSVFGSFLGEQY